MCDLREPMMRITAATYLCEGPTGHGVVVEVVELPGRGAPWLAALSTSGPSPTLLGEIPASTAQEATERGFAAADDVLAALVRRRAH